MAAFSTILKAMLCNGMRKRGKVIITPRDISLAKNNQEQSS